MKFISKATIQLKSGKGGNGLISWRKEKYVRLGGPDGGNGGDGGSIFIEADENLNSLFHLNNSKILFAKDGENGKSKLKNGKNGEDLILKVPCGTDIFNQQTGILISSLIKHKQKILICKGGRGGFGNAHFKSSTLTAPYVYELGDPPQEKTIFLDLKVIADIGFLGKPNAGKSSLLSVISNAKPKIASFPFTTLTPVLGTVNFQDKKLVFADIPGIIENASLGCGLGIEFLKHLERCSALVHVVDISEPNLLEEIKTIEQELLNYSQSLFQKPRILVFNKIDLLEDEKISLLKSQFPQAIYISALKNINLEEFLSTAFKFHSTDIQHSYEKPDYLEIGDDFVEINIERQDDRWAVFHPFLKYWVNKIPRDTFDNIARLTQKVEKFGIKKELLSRGVKIGDFIDIYGWEYKFEG